MPNSDNKIEYEMRLELLYEIGRVLASAETLDEAAPQILEAICRNVQFDFGELWRFNAGETLLHLENVWHLPAAPLETFAAKSRHIEFAKGDGLPGKAWAENTPVWVVGVNQEKNLPRKFFVEEAAFQSGFAFPITLADKLLGVFSFFSRESRQPDEALLEVLAAVGNHIGQFIKREQTESSLRESENRYRAFITQSTEGIWRFELDEKIPTNLSIDEQVKRAFRDGYLAECNDAMARMYGLDKAEDLVGKRIADLFDMTDAANVEYVRAFIESGYNLIDAQSHEKDAGGNDVFFLNSLIGLVENGFLIRVWGTQRNITERRRAERAVLASEESYRIVAETASDAIIKIDAQSRILFVNHSVERVFGYTVEEMTGQQLTMIMPEDLRERHLAGFNRYLASGVRHLSWEGIEIPARHKDGHTFPMEISFGEYNRNDERFFIGIARDIADRKRAEAKILDSEKNMRLATGAARMYSWELDITTQTTAFSENFSEVVGLKEPVAQMDVSETYRNLIHPDDAGKVAEYVERAVAATGSHSVEARLVNSENGETVWIESTGYTVRDDAGNPTRIVGVAQNITDRKQAENRLSLLTEISEMTRALDDPNELLFAVAQAVGEHLEVRRCLFNEIDIERDLETVHRDYCRGVASVAGEHRISDYSSVTSGDMIAGKTVVNRDSKTDSRTAKDYAKVYEPNGERAYVAVPLLRENRWVASLWASDDKPREWSKQEISLLETIAERTWTAIEKLRINVALRESAERLRLATEAAEMFSWESDLRTQTLKWSENAAKVIGCSPEELNDGMQDVLFFVLPEDRERLNEEFAEIYRRGESHYVAEFRGSEPEAERKFWLAQGLIIYDENRVPLRTVGVTQNITQRKRAEQMLVERELLATLNSDISLAIIQSRSLPEILHSCAATIVEHLDAAFARIWTLDDAGEVLELQASAGIYTHTDGAHSRVPVGKFKIGLIAEERKPHVTNSVVGDERVNNQEWAERERMISFAGYPLIVGERLVGVAAMFARHPIGAEAITALESAANIVALGIERKRGEEALLLSEDRFRNLADNMSQFAWMADQTGAIFWYNRRWFEYTGTTLEQMQGWGWQAVHHPEYVVRVTEKFKRYVESGKPWEDTFPIRGADGEYRWFLSRALPIRDASGDIVRWFGTNTDITERKEAEAEREILFAEAQQAREVAEKANHAKDEFIALVSHELRSPLNAMLGWTRILQKKQTDEATTDYALDVIVRNALAQSKLIEDLLDIARIGEKKLRLDLQPTELAPIIKHAVEIIKPTADAKNINISQTLDRAANFIVGDDDRLRQVVENLLSNAVKFTPNDGRIDVLLTRDGDRAKIIISDNGQGISPEFLPQIFELFKQADLSTTRRHGGLGIGLSLAQDLVELHGGAITAESEGEGMGATFTVSLPIRTIAPIKENLIKGEIMDGQGKLSGFWILAVDDEADAREIVSFMLQINGAKVTTANSAVEALEILQQSSDRLPDVLLSDISMPNESGYALLEKIRALPQENGGQIPAVALTAFNRPEDRQSAFEAGFQKHLGKPVEMDDLISAIIETAGETIGSRQ